MDPRRNVSLLQEVPSGIPFAPVEESRVAEPAIPARIAPAVAAPPHIFDPAESAALWNRLANLRSELDQLRDDVNELMRKREGPF
jgi:hypothetical protein